MTDGAGRWMILVGVLTLGLAASACIGGPVDETESGRAPLEDAPQCRDETVDVNDCGDDLSGCRYMRHLLVQEDRGCCAPFLRQHVDKLFWDCNWDGRPDCEMDQWFSYEDPSCWTTVEAAGTE